MIHFQILLSLDHSFFLLKQFYGAASAKYDLGKEKAWLSHSRKE